MKKLMKNSLLKKDEKLLGVDFGERNVGIAFGLAGLTMPLPAISSSNFDTVISSLVRVVYENKVDKIIVGLPTLNSGKYTNQTLKVKDFVKKMKVIIRVPVVFVDEYLSTKEALEKAIGYDISKKKRGNLDSLAAQIILRRYIDEE